MLFSSNNGQTWLDHTSSWKQGLEGTSNSQLSGLKSGELVMIFYRTTANPFELTDNSEFLTHIKKPSSD